MTDIASKPVFWIIVPAAGIGQRMGANIPKQYLTLKGKTVLEHTLERLSSIDNIERILVAIHPQDAHWGDLAISKNPQVETVTGGDERADSVFCALKALEGRAKPSDWVLVHDAARACVLAENIEHLMAEVIEHQVGGILAIPASDTLKQVAGKDITNTLDRRQIWQAQTPQMFTYGLLTKALAQAQSSQYLITDEASAIEALGMQPCVVMGRNDNIKITHPEDLALAEMIMARQLNK